jgi:hypothetical protein
LEFFVPKERRKLASYEVAGGVRRKFFRPGGTAEVSRHDLIEKFRRPFRTENIFQSQPDTSCLANFRSSLRDLDYVPRSSSQRCALSHQPQYGLMKRRIFIQLKRIFHCEFLASAELRY